MVFNILRNKFNCYASRLIKVLAECGTHQNGAEKTPEVVKSVRDHIDSIPKYCSQYSRRDNPAKINTEEFSARNMKSASNLPVVTHVKPVPAKKDNQSVLRKLKMELEYTIEEQKQYRIA
ncbi:hypothetical protein ILUMI_03111 [Ignelater luminosus]|uniref:Uncharacterized protein n=1 Tax=Ignelater luminosus TaxID=2038154 RepID=A0A8K0DGF0_IGNLU|nr:hypothetical protein ILUMI_03111 [Ignelater luminosus]